MGVFIFARAEYQITDIGKLHNINGCDVYEEMMQKVQFDYIYTFNKRLNIKKGRYSMEAFSE